MKLNVPHHVYVDYWLETSDDFVGKQWDVKFIKVWRVKLKVAAFENLSESYSKINKSYCIKNLNFLMFVKNVKKWIENDVNSYNWPFKKVS